MGGKGDRREKEEVKRWERRVCKPKKEKRKKRSSMRSRLEGREGDSQVFHFLHLRGWEWAGGD